MKMKKGNIIFAFAMIMIVLLLFISSSLSRVYVKNEIESTNTSEIKSSFPRIKYLVISDLTSCDITFVPTNNIDISYYKDRTETTLAQKSTADTLFLSSNFDKETGYRYLNVELKLPENLSLIISHNATLLAKGSETKNENESTVQWMLDGGSLTFMPSNGAYDKPFYFANHEVFANRANIQLSEDGHIHSLAVHLSNFSRFEQNNENASYSIDSFRMDLDAHSFINIPGHLLNQMNK